MWLVYASIWDRLFQMTRLYSVFRDNIPIAAQLRSKLANSASLRLKRTVAVEMLAENGRIISHNFFETYLEYVPEYDPVKCSLRATLWSHANYICAGSSCEDRHLTSLDRAFPSTNKPNVAKRRTQCINESIISWHAPYFIASLLTRGCFFFIFFMSDRWQMRILVKATYRIFSHLINIEL